MTRENFHRPRRMLDYQQIESWIHTIAPELRAYDFGAIVGIMRGGAVAALLLSFEIGSAVHLLQFNRLKKEVSWLTEPAPQDKPIILCEDVAGNGLTLKSCCDFLTANGYQYKVLTIVSDALSRVKPDWSIYFDGIQAVFPWERHDYVPSFVEHMSKGGPDTINIAAADHEYEYIGVDIDGVLLDDVPSHLYDQDLDAVLARRDAMSPRSNLPQFHKERHIFITGRPLVDFERTRNWLNKHNWHDIELYCRDPESHSSHINEVARHKAETAARLGCNKFIESCPQQAIQIAIAAPFLWTYWWNDGEMVLVRANTMTIAQKQSS